jgi:site-specific DNA recombinase
VKNNKRYRYYVSQRLTSGCDTTGSPAADQCWRLPAREIERIVSEAVENLLSDESELTRLAREADVEESRISELLANARRRQGDPLNRVSRVELGAEQIGILVDLRDLLRGNPKTIRHTIQTEIRRRGVEKRLVLGGFHNKSAAPRWDPALIKAIARSRQWFDGLVSGEFRSLQTIADAEGVTRHYITRLLSLAFLAPEIVLSVLAGTQPVELTAEMLTKHSDLPLDWEEQRAVLGVS